MYLHGARLQISLLLLMLLSRLNPSRVHWPSTTTGEETTTAGETVKKEKKNQHKAACTPMGPFGRPREDEISL